MFTKIKKLLDTMENKEEYIAVRLSKVKNKYIPSSRYLLWCNNTWYETTRDAVFVFPISEIETLKKQLANHFIYYAAFVHSNGKEELWNFFKKEEKQETKTKGLTFRIKL